MKLRKLTLMLTLVGLALQVHAQPTLRMTLSEAQQYAVEHNQTMRNAELDVKKAEAERWKTLSTMLPTVKAGYDYQNMCGYKMEMNMGGASISIPMDPTGSLSVTAAIALTGSQIVGTMMQKTALEMSDISRQQTEQQTRSQVKNTYVSILVMEETVGLLGSSLANLERLAATSQDAVNVGAAEQVDADKLQVQVATLRSSINTTRRSLQLLRNSMLLQLGADVNAALELATPLDQILNVQDAAKYLNESFNPENNYSYRLLAKNEELAKQQLRMAWMDFSPTLSLFYQYSKKYHFGEMGMDMTPPNMVGFSVSVPLLTTGTRLANLKSAKISLQETRNSCRQAEDGLQMQYNQLRYDLATALETYDIQRSNVDVTQRVFASVSEKYKFGRASSLEVTTASNDIITAQSSYIQSVMNVISAQVALEDMLNK